MVKMIMGKMNVHDDDVVDCSRRVDEVHVKDSRFV